MLLRVPSSSRRHNCETRDTNFVTKDVEHSIGDRSGWANRGDFGPSTSVHSVWMGYTAGHRRGPAREVCVSRRRRNLYSRCRTSLLHRAIGGLDLLRREYETRLSQAISAGVRAVFRGGGAGSDEPGCSAALGAAFEGPVRTSRLSCGSGGAYDRDRIADCL